jgi:P-type Ca2+ transporter type 2C
MSIHQFLGHNPGHRTDRPVGPALKDSLRWKLIAAYRVNLPSIATRLRIAPQGGRSRQVNVIDSAAVAGETASVRVIHSAVPGRARFEVAGLYHGDARARILEGQLRRRSGILSVSASPLTGKVLVLFDPKLDLKQVHTWLEDAAAVAGRWSHTAGKPNNGGNGSLSSFSLSDEDGPIWHCQPSQKAASLLDTSPRTGLRQAMAVERFECFGPNRLPGIVARTGLEIFAEQFNNLPVALLGGAAALSLLTGGVLEAAAIACVVGLNAAIGYATESEAERTINALTDDVHPPATVIRSGRRRQIPA